MDGDFPMRSITSQEMEGLYMKIVKDKFFIWLGIVAIIGLFYALTMAVTENLSASRHKFSHVSCFAGGTNIYDSDIVMVDRNPVTGDWTFISSSKTLDIITNNAVCTLIIRPGSLVQPNLSKRLLQTQDSRCD
jgi:hypothetical protein